METNSSSFSFEKINSKMIFQKIFSFIKNKYYKLQLFKHSKKLQKKAGIILLDYKIAFLSKNEGDFEKYLLFKNDFIKPENKNLLNKNLESLLINITEDFNNIKEYASNSFLNYNFGENDEIKVDIFSPFYDIFLTKGSTKRNFIINIHVDNIKNSELKNDYISAINKLNNSEISSKYPCINFIYKNSNDINYLKDLNINFSLIKKLKLIKEKDNNENNSLDNNDKILAYDDFYNVLFTLPNIQNNLIDLELSSNSNNEITLSNTDSFNLINNLKSLKILRIFN